IAYDPGVVMGYDAELTFLSLAMAIVATWAAVACAAFLPGIAAYLSGGLLFCIGVASMHFTGMTAIDFPGSIESSVGHVFAAIALGGVLATLAYAVALNGEYTIGRKYGATGLLTLGVVALHFTAMGGVRVIPGAETLDATLLMSPSVMVVTIATTSISLLTTGIAAAYFAMLAERKAAAGTADFRRLVLGVSDYAIYMLDLDGKVSNWNAGAERLKGYTANEIVGRDSSTFYSEADCAEGLPKTALDIARTEGKFVAEGWRYRKDGSAFWAHVNIEPIYDDAGELIGFAKITKDNTQLKEDADRIALVSRNLDVALENMSQGICLFDKDENLLLANGNYSAIFGFPQEFASVGRTYHDIIQQGYLSKLSDPVVARTRATEHYERAMKIIRSGGGSNVQKLSDGRSIQTVYNPIKEGGWVATVEDITQRLQSEEKIAFMAQHDGLTGLPN
ncbi:MAG: PAS domain S-box protein, partial [Alphaproteobacteria bacterium]